MAEPPRQQVVKRAVAEPPPSRAEREQRLAEPPRAQEGRWTVAEPPFKHWWKGTGPETDHKNRGTATGGEDGRGREADRNSRDRREADRDSRAGVCNGRCGKVAIRGLHEFRVELVLLRLARLSLERASLHARNLGPSFFRRDLTQQIADILRVQASAETVAHVDPDGRVRLSCRIREACRT